MPEDELVGKAEVRNGQIEWNLMLAESIIRKECVQGRVGIEYCN